ncbi:CPBP family intramembrane glutamic endopeptidase [Roseivirga sp.]|uniref:CPBP family intramembrane glutamic endopeptidase n=1 Tax=Roseivirga sp. TaxID=1964215 RepID=UPI003B8E11C0
MNKLTLKQTVTPLVTLAIICFMYFGPVTRTPFENIVISIIIIIANYFEYKGKPLSALGFQRSKFNAKNLLVYAPLAAFGLFIVYVFALVPGIEMLTGISIDYSSMSQLKGDLPTTIIWLLIVWATAGFGEEIIFRGYFMRQFVKFFGDGKMSLVINILIFSSFFGYMHMQQGITGQLVAASTGALFSIIFYKRKYDLWFMIMLHGIFNTLGLLSFYFGLA